LILITGANGQVGRELKRQAKNAHAFNRYDLDITNQHSVDYVIGKVWPDVVINAAAYTSVDKAEEEPELVFAVNRDGPGYLAEACKKNDIPLIHLSTDYVFDGSKGSYIEDDEVSPLGVYGQSKFEGEEEVREYEKHIIIRTSWVFGVHGNNFVKTVKRTPGMRVVNDQYGCPTAARHLGEVILRLIPRMEWGTYHYCDSPATTWYGLAKEIRDDVMPIHTIDRPTRAKRPVNSVLDCSKIKKVFGIEQRSWLTELENV
jgi:dTDP-4-dehydrorhamnose reductase